ncbi:hypothetical protein [Rhizobium leguminosarum]
MNSPTVSYKNHRFPAAGRLLGGKVKRITRQVRSEDSRPKKL